MSSTQETTAAAEDKVATIFKATLPSINYVFKNGKPAIFIEGKFITAVPAEVAELKDEIAAGHPHIYIDAKEAEIAASAIDPMAGLRAQIEAELMAKMAAATDPSNDMGKTEQEALKPASSTDIAVAAVGGSGTGLAARLMSLGIANKAAGPAA